MSRTIGKPTSPVVCCEHRHRPDVDHLVDRRRQRDRRAGHPRDPRAPDAAGDDDGLGLDRRRRPCGRAGRAPPSTSMPVTSTPAATVSAPRSWRLLAHQRPGLERVDDADRRRVEAAEDHGLVDEGHELLDLGRGHEAGLHAPRRRRRHPALELLHPLRRPGDLDAAGLAVDAELAVLAGAVEREGGHLLAVVGQEDEVRGMAGGAAGVRQDALLEQDDVAPAQPGQVPGHAVADDAGTDDDDACVRRDRSHLASPPCLVPLLPPRRRGPSGAGPDRGRTAGIRAAHGSARRGRRGACAWRLADRFSKSRSSQCALGPLARLVPLMGERHARTRADTKTVALRRAHD